MNLKQLNVYMKKICYFLFFITTSTIAQEIDFSPRIAFYNHINDYNISYTIPEFVVYENCIIFKEYYDDFYYVLKKEIICIDSLFKKLDLDQIIFNIDTLKQNDLVYNKNNYNIIILINEKETKTLKYSQPIYDGIPNQLFEFYYKFTPYKNSNAETFIPDSINVIITDSEYSKENFTEWNTILPNYTNLIKEQIGSNMKKIRLGKKHFDTLNLLFSQSIISINGENKFIYLSYDYPSIDIIERLKNN